MTARRPFAALVLAETLSLTGTRLSMIAIPWLVLVTTGDPFATGIVAFSEMLPYVVVKALAGPLVDRLGPRIIAIVCDAGSVVVIALVPVLDAFDRLDLWTLVPLVAVMGALRGPADAAKHAMVPEVARLGGLALERVTGVLGTIERLASSIGAAAAGGLVALIGAAPALGVTAAALTLSALVVTLGLVEAGRPAPRPAAPSAYLDELGEGWRFLRKDAVLMGIVIMVASTNFFDQAFGAVLLPVWTQQSGHGAALLGTMLAVFSGASVLGAALATGLAERLPRLGVYAVAFLITGFPRFAVFALGAPLPGIFAVLVAAGFASGFLNPIISAVIFERIPRPLVGRVSALVTALAWCLMPFGGLAAGAMIAVTGLPATLALAGIGYLAVTMLPLMLKRFRSFGERPGVETV
jgi:MFS family permease